MSKALVCDGASHENDFGVDVALRQLQFVWIEACLRICLITCPALTQLWPLVCPPDAYVGPDEYGGSGL